MKIFIDSANIKEIEEVESYGILDGVTTNPSLIKQALSRKSVNIEQYIKELLKIVKKKPVSLEVVGTDFKEMVKEGRILHKKFGKLGNIYVKIPVNPCLEEKCSKDADGIKAIKELAKNRISINCTLIFTPEQALLAAKVGAKIVSPFTGREDDYLREMDRMSFKKEDYFPEYGIKRFMQAVDDNGIVSGVDLIRKCVEIFKIHKIKAEILAASIRNARQFREVALVGADIATIPISVIKEILKHCKTAEGMRRFTADVVKDYADLMGKDK